MDQRFDLVGSSAYSRDPEALALNNLGAAEIGLGEMAAAQQHLNRAIEVDSRCPLPYYNMGVLLKADGKTEEADNWFRQAAKLGFTRGPSDKFFKLVQGRFARTDGADHA